MNSTSRRGPILRIIAVLALACGVFAAASSTAGAATTCHLDGYDYGASVVLAANPTRATPGSQVTITGTGYPPNCEVTVDAAGTSVGTATTGADGSFTFTWNVPADQSLGNVTITAVVDGQTLGSTVVEIVASGATTTTVPAASSTNPSSGGSGTLAQTGSDVLPLVFGGLVLLAMGTALLMWNRNRRVADQT